VTIDQTIAWYDRNAGLIAEQYESLQPDVLQGWFAHLLPEAPGLIIDVSLNGAKRVGWPLPGLNSAAL
jgi:hypothetical protein